MNKPFVFLFLVKDLFFLPLNAIYIIFAFLAAFLSALALIV